MQVGLGDGYRFSKSARWAAPLVFGPRTLVRTWGTRPVPCGLGVEPGWLPWFLVSPYALHNQTGRRQNDFDVEQQRPLTNVLQVEPHHFFEG